MLAGSFYFTGAPVYTLMERHVANADLSGRRFDAIEILQADHFTPG